MRTRWTVFCMCLLLNALCGQAPPISRGASTLTLSGKAGGGTLALVAPVSFGAAYVTIETVPGEEAASVVRRLARAANESSEFLAQLEKIRASRPKPLAGSGKFSVPEGLSLPTKFSASGSYLGLPIGLIGGPLLVAGTERGLEGILAPPTCLSATYDEKQNEVRLNWVNPSPNAYELIAVYCEGLMVGGLYAGRSGWVVGGSALKRACERVGRNPADGFSFRVVGYAGAPSNAGSIHVKARVQEELASLPFTSGVAPNWIAWEEETGSQGIRLEQRTKPGMERNYAFDAGAGKPIYQHIGGSGAEAAVGVWRRFLGLTPGHTYKVSVRVNTFSMDASNGDWDFSVHACHDGSGGAPLTLEQFAGRAALPDGTSGKGAGQIACFGPAQTSHGSWLCVSTDGPASGKVVGNIKLPPQVSSITVWLRYRGSTGGVGMDWSALEDVSP